jgi:NTP pyrophosphatase (non-canonical NTP hydrolase)
MTMNDETVSELDQLSQRLREFARVRDWEKFHAPKNLVMAMMVEAAELAEHFQWLSEEQSGQLPGRVQREVEMELADIFIYLVRLADRLGVDLMRAAYEKMEINKQRYPADKVRGSKKKYSEY